MEEKKMLDGWRKVLVAMFLVTATGVFIHFTPTADPALFGQVVTATAYGFFGGNVGEHLSKTGLPTLVSGLFKKKEKPEEKSTS